MSRDKTIVVVCLSLSIVLSGSIFKRFYRVGTGRLVSISWLVLAHNKLLLPRVPPLILAIYLTSPVLSFEFQ